MKHFCIELSLNDIATYVQGKIIKRRDVNLANVAELIEADSHAICFYENPLYLNQLQQTKAGLVFVPTDFDIETMPDTNLLLVEKPYFQFMLLVSKWIEKNNAAEKPSVHASATIAGSAIIEKDVFIGANVVIAEEARIGSGSKIEANCVLKKGVQLGNSVHLHPNVTIYEDCQLGDRVILHSGCVIGADGFGYHFFGGRQIKIPQVGNVVIKDDVEIGANTTIDRATLGSTIIGEGTKIDNVVQVGHNCKIGNHSILCAQVGLAGNTEVGNQVFLAGQVGVAGHLRIGDAAMVGAQSGVAKSVPDGAKYFGTPAIEASLQKRIIVAQHKLPELIKQVKELKKRGND